MSIKVMNWAFSQPLSGNQKVVLLAIADAAGDDGACWPSIKAIAEKAYVSERTVQRIVHELIASGYLATMARVHESGRTAANKYVVLMSEGDSLAPSQGDSLSEGDNAVTHVGDNCVTPLKGTVTGTVKDICPKASPSDLQPAPEARKPRKRAGYPADLEEFWSKYPTDPGMSKKQAADEWAKLSAEDRMAAIAGIPEFKAWVAKQGPDYRIVHACRYLKHRRFETCQPKARSAVPPPPVAPAVAAPDI